MILLLLTTALAQDPVPLAPVPLTPSSDATLPSEAPPAADTDALDPDAEPLDLIDPIEPEEEPEPWAPPETDDARQGVLGPWPDGFVPDAFQRGVDVIDPLSDRVVVAGTPYVSGELFGPVAPSTPEQVDAIGTTVLEPDDVQESVVDAPWSEPIPAATPQLAEPEHNRLLPITPEPSPQRALLAGLLALLFVLLTRGIERGPLARLPSRGLVPLALRGVVVALRLSTLAAVLVAGLMVLPSTAYPAPAYVFVGLAVAVGWTARDVLRDVIAGVVLVVEHRLVKAQRVELRSEGAILSGVVVTVGLRYVELVGDDGRTLTVPNRTLLEAIVRSDPDAFVPVTARVQAPQGNAMQTRKALEELALTSPYLAPGREPEVHRDPDSPNVWIVRARLVDPRWAEAFRGALVELADEVLAPTPD